VTNARRREVSCCVTLSPTGRPEKTRHAFAIRHEGYVVVKLYSVYNILHREGKKENSALPCTSVDEGSSVAPR
jgi:hypothetical protein